MSANRKGARRAAPLYLLAAGLLPGAALAQPAGQVTVLHTFAGSDGGNSYGGLSLDAKGNLYGATSTGGGRNAGTVFRIGADGSFHTLYNFTGQGDGANPNAAPTLAPDGSFYGTARDGSPGDAGTVYHLAADGSSLTTLYSFTGNSDGGNPAAALLLASDGNYYGSTASGGDNATAASSLFRLTPGGTLTTLYTFGFGADGGVPYGALVQGADGNLYGTASADGAHSAGTVFKLSLAGTFSTLYTFSGDADGAAPEGGLVQGKDGNFYGTTSTGHSLGSNHGTVFRINPAGALTTLYSFGGASDGDAPEAALVQGGDGNFYGTTAYGGANGDGTVFQITPAGALTTLYSFTGGADGKYPMASLAQGSDGALYGTTASGGTADNGAVFKLTVTAGAAGGGSSSSGGASSSSSSSGSASAQAAPAQSASGGGSFGGLPLVVLALLRLLRRTPRARF